MKYKPPKMNASVSVTAFVIIVSLLFALPQPASSCGPFFTDAIFVFTKHPDFPLDRFAQGQLGVIQPSYARSYLFAAYRNLVGEKLSDGEISALKSLWGDRLNNVSEIDDAAWIKTWTGARQQVTGVSASPEIRAFRNREKPHEY